MRRRPARGGSPCARSVGALAAVACLALAAAAHGQVKNWPSQSPPRPLASRDLKFPPYQTRTLANGLQVIVVTHAEQPAVTLRMLVKAGTIDDPRGKPGVAALAASLLDQGSEGRSAAQVADALDSMGGAMESGVGRDLTFADMVVMKDDVAEAMGLLADIIRRPSFDQAEIERQRQQVLAGLKVGLEDPEYVANVAFDRLVYGFSAYGYPGNGTAESVPAITRDDLVGYHARLFAPNNALLAVVGDIGADEALAGVEKAFGDWPPRALPPGEGVELPPMAKRVIVIDKPDAVQTEIRVGHAGVPRTHPSFLKLEMAVRILGGEGANRLHQVLRTERGLTYGASADIEALEFAGQVAVSTNTRSETTAEVLRLIVDEFSRLRRERVGDNELADAKAYVIGHYPLTVETPNDIATQVLDHLFFGLPLSDLETYRQRVGAIGVGDVASAAWDFIRSDRLSVVLVGNASAFVKDLGGAGFGRYERIPIGELDLLAADFRRK